MWPPQKDTNFFQLPVIQLSKEPRGPPTVTFLDIIHPNIFWKCYKIKIWEQIPQRCILASLILQEFRLNPGANLKTCPIFERLPTISNCLLNPPLHNSLTFFVHQPPSSCPYFPTITCFQRLFFFTQDLQDHFPRRALLKVERFLKPKPLFCLSK